MSVPNRWLEFISRHIGILRGYFWALGGSAGRLVISLVYFVTIANTLSIAEFGLFATATATGMVLSRIAGFGFTSPLYRIATVKPRLIGVYTAGYLAAVIISIPVVLIAAAMFYFLVFRGDLSFGPFIVIIIAEVYLWRTAEVVMIVRNGMGGFDKAAILVVAGSALRAVAAVVFSLGATTTLAIWVWYYFAANCVIAILAVALFYPRQPLRWHPALYMRRWRDSVSVAAAEILFYLQSELDKLLMLSLSNPETAGIYAIIMRLVDLTALPIRSFNMMLVQAVMRSWDTLATIRTRLSIEIAIAAISTAALLVLAGFLSIYPNALGSNVSVVSPLLILVFAVPALRNLTEYQSELLYASGQTVRRTVNMAIIGLVKGGLLSLVLLYNTEVEIWIRLLNGIFLAVYLVSFILTYLYLRKPERRVI